MCTVCTNVLYACMDCMCLLYVCAVRTVCIAVPVFVWYCMYCMWRKVVVGGERWCGAELDLLWCTSTVPQVTWEAAAGWDGTCI